jgi:hypothetical protein
MWRISISWLRIGIRGTRRFDFAKRMKNFLLFISLCLGTSYVFAMHCVPNEDEAVIKSAEIALIGEIVAIENSVYQPHAFCWRQSGKKSNCGGRLATVKVSEWLRGSGGETITILKEDGCYCLGGYWKPGEQYLFVAKNNQLPSRLRGDLIAQNVCSGTGLLDSERKSLAAKFRSRPISVQIK